jgi:hypothetical protein
MKTDYNKQATNFLKRAEATLTLKYMGNEPHFEDDKEKRIYRDRYKCTFANGKKHFSVIFGQSIANRGKKPTTYHILACLTKYDPKSFENFCGEFGYDTDSRKAEKTYKAVYSEWEKVKAFFTEEELEILREIQ